MPINYKGTVIRDLTHSIYSEKYNDADYYFGSLRKWFGISSGGFAWSDKRPIVEATESENNIIVLEKAAMLPKVQIH